MKKVLFVTGSQGLSGGTERACANIVNRLSRSGQYEVAVLSAANGNRSFFETDPRVELREIYSNSGSLQLRAVGFILRLRTFIKEYRPDIVVIVESFLAAFVLPACFALSVKTINWEHFGADVSLGTPLRRIARHLAARYSNHVVVLTEADRRRWLEKYKIREGRISVIRNMNPLHHSREGREDQGERMKTVLAVGRLVREKGYDLLLNAWGRIETEYRIGWRLRLVGDGPLRSELEELALRLGILEEIEFAGRRADVANEYKLASIFALSSRFEGFGLVIVEAMTFGLPVVSFNCPDGPGELIEHQVSGVLVKHLDIDGMADALAFLMTSPGVREVIGLRGQANVGRFAPDDVAREWLTLLAST
ncbi:glycosyltransferase family 4 protein [Cupriavidus sp. CuC1]|uniref:glycosyltransferase family 4 protein n=1 Tax=Cupriavidus sp. CuC1 TaxID=3373131 RepID=UPI0037D23F58